MSLPVFLASPAELAATAPGTVTFSGPEAAHAATVRRIRVGERIDVADGEGRRVRGVVEVVSKHAVTVRAQEWLTDRDSGPRLVLVQALAKGGRDEQAVETATELGVEEVIPWQAARSVSVWHGPKQAKGVARWEAVARAATKQSRRALVPAIAAPLDTKALATWVRSTREAGGVVALLHEEATAPVACLAAPARWDNRPSVGVIVGPEGGIGSDETPLLVAAGAELVRLGPHVLRSSTAGPVALAVIGQKLGLWD